MHMKKIRTFTVTILILAATIQAAALTLTHKDGTAASGEAEAWIPEAGVPDALFPEASVPEAGAPETGVPQGLAQWRKATYRDVRYRLHFNIPEARDEQVTGEVTVTLVMERPADIILDFREPASSIHSVSINAAGEMHGTPGETPYLIRNEHIIIPAAMTRAGENTVDILFTAGDQSLNRNDGFMYTLLVPDRARTLFPCFDQPDIKALYTLSLELPADWTAVSNTYIASEEEIAPQSRKAAPRKLTTFSETEPLSTYLFSFVAGEFRRRDFDNGRHRFSAYYRETDTAKTSQLDGIFAQVAASLDWMEEYTGIPYPFAKYDFVILPGFQYGGMEHTGATLYNDGRMFLGPNPTLSDSLARTELIAHETAHMWFGDLVTMEWFDEVWTKEVFANHFAAWISEPLYPEVNHRLNRLRSFSTAALSEDRTEGTVSISQELPNLSYAGLVYGQIIYNKAPVMMEKLIGIMGPEAFREGIRTYLERYSYGNATWDDLVGILDSLTSADLRGFSRAWVYGKGMPDLTFTLSRNASEVSAGEQDNRPPVLEVTQTDPHGRGLLWPQSFEVTVTDWSGNTWTADVTMDGDTSTVYAPCRRSSMPPRKADSGIYGHGSYDGNVCHDGYNGYDSYGGYDGHGSRYYILPNTDGRGYGRFILPSATARWLLGHWPEIHDGTARFSTLMNLHENYLAGLVSASDWSRSILSGLGTETDQLTASSLTGFLGWTVRDLSGSERETVERQMWKVARTHPETAVRTVLMRSLPSLVTCPALCDSLYSIWASRTEPLYGENDYTTLAWELAVRFPDRADAILRTQRQRLSDPDRIRRFDYISRALDPDSSARDTLFYSLMLADNRRIEPWTASVLSYLNHPLREASSVRYIRPGLEILEEVQRTGDIFFPRNWAGALLGGHRSREAWQEVRTFLENRPDYPQLLRNKILQAAYPLVRANTSATVRTTPEDSAIYAKTMRTVLRRTCPDHSSLDRHCPTAGDLMILAAKALYGTPYVGGTLESVPEALTVNLRETDCILFVEACTAMTLLATRAACAILPDTSPTGTDSIPPFDRFCDMVRTLRYRGGIVNGYPSRLHYTSEWLLQAQRNGILREITRELGGIPLDQEFSFMSSHRDNYPRLRNDPEASERIRRAELQLDTATAYFCIPSGKIPEIEDNILDGDIICFVSKTPGLDITHVGIACRDNDGSLHFIHASMREGKVVFEKKTLAEYARNGIRIARLL